MPTNAPDSKTPDTTLWLPPLSPKEQHRIDRTRRHQSRPTLGEWSGFKGKTLWDYLNLLAVLAIPVLIAAGTLWYTSQQTQATAIASTQQHQTDESLAEDQQEETALQTYLDRMSDLLLTDHLATSQDGNEVRLVARARTVTLLPHLNGIRKGEVIRFLYKTNLIGYYAQIDGPPVAPIVELGQAADLSHADLRGAELNGANLSHANLVGADLSGAEMAGAELNHADLSHANLNNTYLDDADLVGAELNGANLTGVGLSNANLNYANLRGANLSDASLSGADLSNAEVTVQQLNAAQYLDGTTLPNGSKHP